MINIHIVETPSQIETYLPSLRRLLQANVNEDPSTSSIGFLAPLSDQDALNYWLDLIPTTFSPIPSTILIVATDTDSDSAEVLATAQIARIPKQTHAHRGEVKKLLVDPKDQRRGLGEKMMAFVEGLARDELGMEVLVLDTAKETPARDFYLKIGWTEWGVCPIYAKFANGVKGDCSFFVKTLTNSRVLS